ncbi:hypothetical protein VP277E431_P0073 [Vibrio phage 277E43-1]|nr:hypothetical protein VP277E431_P0073 [Vibrio phage 277E43-1]
MKMYIVDSLSMISLGDLVPSKHKHPWWNKSRW